MNTFDGYSPLLIVHFSSFDVLTPYRPFSAKLFHPSVNLPVMEEMMFEKVSRFTRRTFFKGAGTAVATTALLGQIHSQHMQQAQARRKRYKAQHLELDSMLSLSTGAL